MEDEIEMAEKFSEGSNDSSNHVREQSQLSMPPPARKSVLPPAPRFNVPGANPRNPTETGPSTTPITAPSTEPAAADGTDQHFRPPPPKFQSREAAPGIAGKTANGQAYDTAAAPAPRSSGGALP